MILIVGVCCKRDVRPHPNNLRIVCKRSIVSRIARAPVRQPWSHANTPDALVKSQCIANIIFARVGGPVCDIPNHIADSITTSCRCLTQTISSSFGSNLKPACRSQRYDIKYEALSGTFQGSCGRCLSLLAKQIDDRSQREHLLLPDSLALPGSEILKRSLQHLTRENHPPFRYPAITSP